VRVRDVGQVGSSVENVKVGGWVNGKPAVIIDVQRQPGANVVATADGVKAALPQLKTALPQELNYPSCPTGTQTVARLRFRCAIHADVDGAAGCNRYLFFPAVISCDDYSRCGAAVIFDCDTRRDVVVRISVWIIYPNGADHRIGVRC